MKVVWDVRSEEHWVDALTCAIIGLAVYDYESALRRKKWLSDPKSTDEIQRRIKSGDRYYAEWSRTLELRRTWDVIKECEEFFRSDWFMMLCECDGERMIRNIQTLAGV